MLESLKIKRKTKSFACRCSFGTILLIAVAFFFKESLGELYDFLIILLPALLGALIGYILTEGIDPLDDWFDKDIIDEYVINRINKKIMYKADNDKNVIKFEPINDNKAPDIETWGINGIKEYKTFTYKYKWYLQKDRIRCIVERDENKKIINLLLDETGKPDNSKSELCFPRLNISITIPMCLELKIKKPIYEEDLEDKRPTYIYTTLRLYQEDPKKIEIRQKDNQEIELYDYEKYGGYCITQGLRNNKEFKEKNIPTENIVSKINLETSAKKCFDEYFNFVADTKIAKLYNVDKEKEKNVFTFINLCGRMPLNVTQTDLSNYSSRLSSLIFDIDEKLLDVYFPKPKYLKTRDEITSCKSKFEKEQLVTDDELKNVIETEKSCSRKFLSVFYTGEEAEYYLQHNSPQGHDISEVVEDLLKKHYKNGSASGVWYKFDNHNYGNAGSISGNNKTTSQLGYDIIAYLITKRNMEEKEISDFTQKLKTIKENNEYYKDGHQKEIIYIGKPNTGDKVNSTPIPIASGEIYVIKHWDIIDIIDLMKYIRESKADVPELEFYNKKHEKIASL